MSQLPESIAARAFKHWAVGIVDGPEKTRLVAIEVTFKASGDHHAWAMTVPEAKDLAETLEIMEEADARQLGKELAYACKQAMAQMGAVQMIKPERPETRH